MHCISPLPSSLTGPVSVDGDTSSPFEIASELLYTKDTGWSSEMSVPSFEGPSGMKRTPPAKGISAALLNTAPSAIVPS